MDFDLTDHLQVAFSMAFRLRPSPSPKPTTTAPYAIAQLTATVVRRGPSPPAKADPRTRPRCHRLRWEWKEMVGNGSELKVSPLLATPDQAPSASLSRPRSQPPRPGRSARQTTTTRQLTVADMPKSEYDDSNAAARPRFRPVARVTHLHTPQTPVPKVPTSVARPTPTRSDPGRSQGTPPEPVPVPATQSRRWRHRLPSFP